MEILDREATWMRPKTTRRYLHGPMAERLVTLWAEGKIMMGEIYKGDGLAGYHKLMDSGIWLVHGDDEQFDYTKAENIMDPDGIPVHGLIHRAGELQVEIESFCSQGLKPTCFVKLTLTNTGKEKTDEKMGFYLRYGCEEQLVFGAPDEYTHYDPDISVWKNTPSVYQINNGVCKCALTVCDDEAFVTADGDIPLSWDGEKGVIRWNAALNANESKTLYFSMGIGKPLSFDYEQERTLTYEFWKRELNRITKLPEKLKADSEKVKLVKNLTVQMLQCFCRPIGKNFPLARQGGLHRLIWPWEALPMIQALGDIGEFADYIEPVIGAYFDALQTPYGEIVPFGIGWANVTASALYSFAHYARYNSRRFWYKYRDNAMAAFEWIKSTRASTVEDKENDVFAGLFPPKQGTDWPQVFQVWASTDLTNLDGLKMLTEAAEYFGDERAEEIRAEYEDYLNVLRKCYDVLIKEDEDKDTLRAPLCPSGKDDYLYYNFYPSNGTARFLRTGVLDLKYTDKVEKWMVEMDRCHDGLYGHMLRRNGNKHIWYVSIAEYDWFMAKMMQGKVKDAEKIYQSQIKWAMTDEYYMIERYADNDEYFVPWSPNASASGRTMLMLLELTK